MIRINDETVGSAPRDRSKETRCGCLLAVAKRMGVLFDRVLASISAPLSRHNSTNLVFP